MRILAADIGGTSSRFALFTGEQEEPLRLEHCVVVSSRAENFNQVLTAAEQGGTAFDQADIFVLAVAGPRTDNDFIKPSNLPYSIDLPKIRTSRSLGGTLLINDFTAQAWAVLSPAMGEAVRLNPTPGAKEMFTPGPGVYALIGAGTGLGMSLIMTETRQAAKIFPSEGGHAAFPFTDREETEFAVFAKDRLNLPYPRQDDIISGRGLSLLHEYLTGHRMPPGEIAATPGFDSSATCCRFARFYARACRNFALTTLPAGLILTGGMAAKCPGLIRHAAFMQEFCDAPGGHGTLLASLPLWHNRNQLSGLWGAALAGRAELFRQGVRGYL